MNDRCYGIDESVESFSNFFTQAGSVMGTIWEGWRCDLYSISCVLLCFQKILEVTPVFQCHNDHHVNHKVGEQEELCPAVHNDRHPHLYLCIPGLFSFHLFQKGTEWKQLFEDVCDRLVIGSFIARGIRQGMRRICDDSVKQVLNLYSSMANREKILNDSVQHAPCDSCELGGVHLTEKRPPFERKVQPEIDKASTAQIH
mmetsp:Transcript_33264/g.52000  ORF Transcript_33264/g.52000 Transcript_33264/m.52000 type:complete len:200 (+) Transcript_33264:156-755(+)